MVLELPTINVPYVSEVNQLENLTGTPISWMGEEKIANRPLVLQPLFCLFSRLQIAANTSDLCLINDGGAHCAVRCAAPTDRDRVGRHRKVFQLFTNALSRRAREGGGEIARSSIQ